MRILLVLDRVENPASANALMGFRLAEQLLRRDHTVHILTLWDGLHPPPAPPEGAMQHLLAFADERQMNEALENGQKGGTPVPLRLARLAAHPAAAAAAFRQLGLKQPRRTVDSRREIERLDAEFHFDAVCAVCAPYRTAFALEAAAIRGKKFLWQLDPYASNRDYTAPGGFAREGQLLDALNGTFVTPQALPDYADGAPLAIIFHGYRGYAERDGLGGYTLCTALGYNVLLPDQRAHGYSGGHTITMGVKERYDARDWTVWARIRFGPEVPIFLMGVSMGAATVLLAAGLNLPDNVCGIVADCGYTSPREITRKCLPEYLPGMPLELTYAVGRLGAILFGHFDPEDADCEAAAAQSKVPILFVHGDADGFVPYDMGKRNYEACRAKGKKFLTVHGAEHAVSYYHDNDAYTKQATEFLQDCLARRGFVWPPETDEPEK